MSPSKENSAAVGGKNLFTQPPPKLLQKDFKTKKAVERNIEIIGEAVNRIMNYKNAEIEIQNAKQIGQWEPEGSFVSVAKVLTHFNLGCA